MDGDEGLGNDTTDERVPRQTDQSSLADHPISIDELLGLLATEQTRYLLYLLTDRGGTIYVGELEDYFEDSGNTIELHHNQLPRLMDHNLIEYDRATDAVTLTPLGDDLKPFLEMIWAWDDDADGFLHETRREH